MASTSFRDHSTVEISDSEDDNVIESSLIVESEKVIPSSGDCSEAEESFIKKPSNKQRCYVISSDEENDKPNSDYLNLDTVLQKMESHNLNGSAESTVSDDEDRSVVKNEIHQLDSNDRCNSSSETIPYGDGQVEEEPIEILSPQKSSNRNSFIDFKNNDAESYFEADTQLAILESLKYNERKSLQNDILSPVHKKTRIESPIHMSPKNVNIIHEVPVNISPLSGAPNSDNNDGNDLTGNKENILAEKMRLEFEIDRVRESIIQKKETLNTINLNGLPDKGMKLKISYERELRNLDMLNEQLNRVNDQLKSSIKKPDPRENPPKFSSLPSANLNDMGDKALETHRVQQALTVDALRHLHNSLNSCPSSDVIVSDPTGLKIPLMDHQKQALAWLMWREGDKPPGGILADDMGLGKTLTMISLILKRSEESDDNDDDDDENDFDDFMGRRNKYKGGTLIVCPSSLIGQWESEIKHRVKQATLTYEVHHGARREKKPRRLAKPDVVITSYSIVRVEYKNAKDDNGNGKSMQALFSIKWKRIILDEAHTIRNHKTQSAEAVFELKGFHRWALTGTPVHNKSQDFFALLKFIRCRPFDDLTIWKKWVEAKDETGSKRLDMLTKSLMLRRTKENLMNEGKLQSLPEKTCEVIMLHLNKDELALYEEVSNFSKTLLSQLLCQRAEKEQLLSHGIQVSRNKFNIPESENPFRNHPALDKLYNRVVNMGNVKTHEILVLLLRLRQICCHPALIKSMVEKDAIIQDGVEDGTDVDLLQRMSTMNVNEDEDEDNDNEKKSVFSLNNPIFQRNQMSSKIKAIVQLLEENLLKTDDKIVIVSQWSSMLDLINDFLKKLKNCKCAFLTGNVPVDQRMSVVSEFNRPSSTLKVLLLSLTAGGTGLNLVGGNHLILTDLHWNPQLEAQACDRIYRMGQNKPVTIYKFVCAETIEERIQMLQTDKLALADGILSGANHLQVAKLSLNDMKMLFNIN